MWHVGCYRWDTTLSYGFTHVNIYVTRCIDPVSYRVSCWPDSVPFLVLWWPNSLGSRSNSGFSLLPLKIPHESLWKIRWWRISLYDYIQPNLNVSVSPETWYCLWLLMSMLTQLQLNYETIWAVICHHQQNNNAMIKKKCYSQPSDNWSLVPETAHTSTYLWDW